VPDVVQENAERRVPCCDDGANDLVPFETIEYERLPGQRATRIVGRCSDRQRTVVVADSDWFLQAHGHLTQVHVAAGEALSDALGEHAFTRAAVAFLMD
jgi:hypothetical protein